MCVFRKIDSKTAKTLCEEYKFSFNIVLEDDYYKILDSNGFIIGVIVYTVGENEIDVDYFEVVQKKQGYGKKIINNFIFQKINNGIKKITLTSLNSARGFWEKMGFSFMMQDEDRMERVL